AVKSPIALLLGDSNVLLEPTGAIAGAGRMYAEALQAFNQAVTQFTVASGLPSSDVATLGALLPAALAARASDVLASSNRLNAWCAWRKTRAAALALGLAPVVAGVEQGAIQLGRVKEE